MSHWVPLALACWLSVNARAEAPTDTARCVLRLIHALPEAGPPDPRLADIHRLHLSKPPFSVWRSFRLLADETRELRPRQQLEFSFPEGQKASLLYTEHLTDPSGKHRVRGTLHVQGAHSGAGTGFSLDEGGLFMVAGQRLGKGILIYALSCRTED